MAVWHFTSANQCPSICFINDRINDLLVTEHTCIRASVYSMVIDHSVAAAGYIFRLCGLAELMKEVSGKVVFSLLEFFFSDVLISEDGDIETELLAHKQV